MFDPFGWEFQEGPVGKSSCSKPHHLLRAGKKDQKKLKPREGALGVSCLKPRSWVPAGSRLDATTPRNLDQRSFQ